MVGNAEECPRAESLVADVSKAGCNEWHILGGWAKPPRAVGRRGVPNLRPHGWLCFSRFGR